MVRCSLRLVVSQLSRRKEALQISVSEVGCSRDALVGVDDGDAHDCESCLVVNVVGVEAVAAFNGHAIATEVGLQGTWSGCADVGASGSLSWERHQHALLTLGYFQRRDFALKRRALTNNREFMGFVDRASFRDDQWMLEPHTDRVVVTGYRGDMGTWAHLVQSFESAQPIAEHERRPGGSISSEDANDRPPEIRRVVESIARLKPGMTRQQVWHVWGKLPLEDKEIWVAAGSDWGEGCDSYLLKHGYSIRLLWDKNENWIRLPWDQTDEDSWMYRRAWLEHNNKNRIEF